jgi:capsular exopolysaccharide synthesis family protein
VSTDPTTGFITITAQADSPARAAEVANAFGAAINSARAQGAVVQLDRQIVSIKAQVKALPKSAVTPRNQLITQLERLRAQRAAQGANAQIIEPATAKASPISPRPARNTLLALIVAILLGLGAVALVENLDRRIRRPEELEELVGIPLLSSVPKSAFGGTDTPSSIEGFRTLRANLTFFNVDRDINSIVIASARQDEGKSIVAVGLAKAFAMSGSDVILIDADLRRPTLATRLKLDAAAGLAGVLVGKCEVGDCLVDYEVRGRDAGRLRVLSAGEIPPNPGELLGSQRMHRLIEELSTMSDLLVIDTSPLMAVSDALPLLDEVPGTLLVARLGVVHRDDLRYLKKVLGSARASVLGVVATGVSERAAYPYVSAAYIDQPDPPVSSNGDTQKSRGPLAALGRRRR